MSERNVDNRLSRLLQPTARVGHLDERIRHAKIEEKDVQHASITLADGLSRRNTQRQKQNTPQLDHGQSMYRTKSLFGCWDSSRSGHVQE